MKGQRAFLVLEAGKAFALSGPFPSGGNQALVSA